MSANSHLSRFDATKACSGDVGFSCRICASTVTQSFCDLGASPLANSYVDLSAGGTENFYPLHAYVCSNCFLVQLNSFESPDAIFAEYAYFSSFSSSWLDHCRDYVVQMIERFGLNPSSLVIEAASNDGYLLQYFKMRGIPVLGIEPAANVAEAARAKGIRTEVQFLGASTASGIVKKYGRGDLVLGNNVIAHVPDLRDFIEGVSALLKPEAIATFEFPHLLRLIEFAQFDTIYHEHFSYFSLHSITRAFAAHDMAVVDVEELPTHGGSLRIFVSPRADVESDRVREVLAREREAGLLNIRTYEAFQAVAERRRRELLAFLTDCRRDGATVAGYGAPAKGNTLLNFAGVTTDLLPFTVDKNPYKQGKLLPGTAIPVLKPVEILERRPDFVLVLPWNLRDEISAEIAAIRDWGGSFVVAIPQLEVF